MPMVGRSAVAFCRDVAVLAVLATSTSALAQSDCESRPAAAGDGRAGPSCRQDQRGLAVLSSK